jgi:hypothetical protein
MMSMTCALAVGIGSMLSGANVLHAQTIVSNNSDQIPRASGGTLLRNSIIGAVSGTAMAFGYYFMSEKGERSNGCQPLNCALPFLATAGAVSGLFIGRELDSQRRAFAPRAGDKIDFRLDEATVLSAPTYFDVRDSLVAVVSDSGAQLFSATPNPKALRRRASGLSAMRQVALLNARSTIVLGTGTALWEANQVTGPATRLADGAVDALAASRDALLSATGTTLRLREGEGATALVDSITMATPATAITYDSIANAWWVSSNTDLMQFTHANGKLTQTPIRLSLPASARSLAISADWIAAALGDEGVVAWRRNTLRDASPTTVRITNEPRFAYDLAFLGDALYVAGGVDGLFQLALAPQPRVVGSSRQLQFATTVRAAAGVLWVGDRNRQSIVRITPQ